MSSSDPPSKLPYARDWAALINPPANSTGDRMSLSLVGGLVRSVSSQGQPGTVTHSKPVVVLHTKTLYWTLCCSLIVDKVGKAWFQTAGACNIHSHSNICRRVKFEAGIYFCMPREKIAHCFPVGDVALFDLHCNAIADFTGRSVSDWTVALNT